MTGVLAGLTAALAWTTASAIWRTLSSFGSALKLNSLKNALATLFFLPVLITLPWQEQQWQVWHLLFSGVVGIAIGDSFYLAALRRLGTRRTLTVEALGPVLANIGSVSLMGEALPVQAWIGACLVSVAVLIIANSSQSKTESEHNRSGLLFALCAVLSGLTGAFIARQVLIQGSLSPIQTAAVRLLGGWLALLPFSSFSVHFCRHQNLSAVVRILMATAIGTNLGIALQQLVFQKLPVGPGVTLMSTAPVMALAFARYEGDPLHRSGVIAALLAVIGVALTSLWS